MRPIYFHPETVEWLSKQQPWPPTLAEDLDQISKHNAKYELIVKQR